MFSFSSQATSQYCSFPRVLIDWILLLLLLPLDLVLRTSIDEENIIVLLVLFRFSRHFSCLGYFSSNVVLEETVVRNESRSSQDDDNRKFLPSRRQFLSSVCICQENGSTKLAVVQSFHSCLVYLSIIFMASSSQVFFSRPSTTFSLPSSGCQCNGQ